jgi:hypothetical protein
MTPLRPCGATGPRAAGAENHSVSPMGRSQSIDALWWRSAFGTGGTLDARRTTRMASCCSPIRSRLKASRPQTLLVNVLDAQEQYVWAGKLGQSDAG